MNADGIMDTDMMALQAVDLVSQKLEEIGTQVSSLGQTVTSLEHFRTAHLRDHEFEESKQQEFASYFDRGPNG